MEKEVWLLTQREEQNKETGKVECRNDSFSNAKRGVDKDRLER